MLSGFRADRSRTRRRLRIAVLGVGVGLGGCAVPGILTGSSTCAEFNAADLQPRQQVVADLYKERHGTISGLGVANAMLNTEYVCERRPDMRIEEVDF